MQGGAPACKHRLCTASFLSVFFPKLLELVVRCLDLLLRLAPLPRPELFWRLFGSTYSFFVSFSVSAQCLRPLLHTLPTYFARCTMRPPIFTTGVTLCSFCSYIHNPGPCILGGWSLCVEWASVVAKIAPQDSDTFYSTLKTLLFSRARVG